MVTNDGHGNDGSIDLDHVVVKYGGSCRAMITNHYEGSACDQYGNLGTQTTIDHSVIQCSLTDGIHLDNQAALMISNSVIADNNGDGVFSDGSAPAIATQNWWGAADGPGPVGLGSGDGVSANVDFSNWLTADPIGYSSCLPAAVPPGPPVVGGLAGLLNGDEGVDAAVDGSGVDHVDDFAAVAGVVLATLITGGWYVRKRWLR